MEKGILQKVVIFLIKGLLYSLPTDIQFHSKAFLYNLKNTSEGNKFYHKNITEN